MLLEMSWYNKAVTTEKRGEETNREERESGIKITKESEETRGNCENSL